jgi:type I restriction enzyme S subunit
LHFYNVATGSTIKNLSLKSIQDFEVPFPTSNEWKKIVAVLSALDSKIELNNKINTELESMAKTLYDYWFVQFDFPDKDGNPYKTSGGKMVWNDELKREIPGGWEVKNLGDITSISNESINPMNSPNTNFKHYSIPTFDELGTYKVEKGEDIKSNKFTVEDTDVLVSKLNPHFSRVIYSTHDDNLICSTEFVVWRTSNIEIKNYMYMIARDYSFITFCTKSSAGTSNSHKRVNPTVMMKYKVAYQQRIAERFGSILGSTIKMYAKNQIENKTLSELRDWLLPMLMNGQVRVE